ncbi:hypothetical protein [Litoreibacter albidus]|uniref:hypothetical protein n=1 Tax=Litoreibacter albidus TaxID=670155 RepID=UPI0037362627
MTVIIRDNGMSAEDWPHGFTRDRREISGENGAGLDLACNANLSSLQGRLNGVSLIRRECPIFCV